MFQYDVIRKWFFFVERTLQHLQFQGPAACPLCCARHICSVSSLLRSSIQAITKIASFLLPQGNHGHFVQAWSQKTTVVQLALFWKLLFVARDPVLMGPRLLWGCSGLYRSHALEGQVIISLILFSTRTFYWNGIYLNEMSLFENIYWFSFSPTWFSLEIISGKMAVAGRQLWWKPSF